MGRYIRNRLLWMIPVLIGVAVMIFSIMYFVPGDPAAIILGKEAEEWEILALRQQMGLEDPFLVQLGRFLWDALHLNFGESYFTGIPVIKEIAARMPRTTMLGFLSMFFTMLVGVPLGIYAATHRGQLGDSLVMALALVGVSFPAFWMALMLVLVFSLRLHWFPATGIGSWKNYVLPVLASTISGVGTQARLARSSMLEVIRSDYITTARSKGLKEREVIYKHALPNALLPILTSAGSRLAHIFGGSTIIETVFSIPGIGTYMINAVNNRDYPIVRASVLVLAILFSLVMLLVDLAYAFVDPRIKARYAGTK